METVRICFTLAKLNELDVCAGDIGNAYLYGKTKEKVYIIAGPEFGVKLLGKKLIIDKALYGLKSSSARFHEHLSGTLLSMGYKPSKQTMTCGLSQFVITMNILQDMWMM